jgi:hypothetical protein
VSDIQQEVREMLQSKSNRAPVMDEPPRPLLRRARTRKALNTTGIAAAVILIAAGSVLAARSFGKSIEPVVRPPTETIPWAPLPVTVLGKERPCRASDLNFMTATGGTWRLRFQLKRTDLRCALDAKFGLRLLDPAGKSLDVRVLRAPDFGGVIHAEGTSDTNDLLFDWGGCVPVGPIRFDVTLAHGGGELSAVAPVGGPTNCVSGGPTTLTFKSVSWTKMREAGDVTDLMVQLDEIPGSVSRGGILRYVVKLSNLSGKVITLDPCPFFIQSLQTDVERPGIDVLTTVTDYMLNCAAAPPSVPNRGTLRFEMRVTVPADAKAGLGEIGWGFETLGSDQPTEIGTRASVLISD